MSIALEAKVGALEKRIAELETALGMFGSHIEFVSKVAQLDLRIERIEQAGKPAQKAKNG